MKKFLAIMFSLLTVFSVALTFGGCKSSVNGKYLMWGVKIGDTETAFADMTEEQKEEYFVFEMTNEDSYLELKKSDVIVMGAVYIYEDKEGVKNDKYKVEYFRIGTYTIFDQKLIAYFEPAVEGDDDGGNEMVIRDGKIYVSFSDDFSFIYKK